MDMKTIYKRIKGDICERRRTLCECIEYEPYNHDLKNSYNALCEFERVIYLLEFCSKTIKTKLDLYIALNNKCITASEKFKPNIKDYEYYNSYYLELICNYKRSLKYTYA